MIYCKSLAGEILPQMQLLYDEQFYSNLSPHENRCKDNSYNEPFYILDRILEKDHQPIPHPHPKYCNHFGSGAKLLNFLQLQQSLHISPHN